MLCRIMRQKFVRSRSRNALAPWLVFRLRFAKPIAEGNRVKLLAFI
jgi:hypothetical protein